MSHSASPKTLADLNTFQFQRILNDDPMNHSIALFGTFPNPESPGSPAQAVVRIEKTALRVSDAPKFFGRDGLVTRVELEESTDIYTWLFGWLGSDRERDIKINIICPATEVHIRKYSKQDQIMVTETPAIYEEYVKPYISAFPASRTKWVENILNGVSEQSKVLYSSPSFLLVPDMKWDLKTISSLYLVALVQDRSIRSLRDLRRHHLHLLTSIRREANRVAFEKWGIKERGLRTYIHYQPSYYHFHVHIVNSNYQGGMLGMMVGQAHLLDDIISLLELDPEQGPGIFERMTLTYGLGDQHGLFEILRQTL